MLTVKYIDSHDNETILPNIERVHKTCDEKGGEYVTCTAKGDGLWTFGPNAWGERDDIPAGSVPTVFVMNDGGSTVARYDLHPVVLAGPQANDDTKEEKAA